MIRVYPIIFQAARTLQRYGYRVTSIARPGGGGHARGRALDVAFLMFSPGRYDLQSARRVLNILNVHHPAPWWVISEDDHMHVEFMPENVQAIGLKNRQTGNALRVFRQ